MGETILTNEQIEEISNTVDESVANSITATTMEKAKEEREKAEKEGLKNESAIVAIDRETGKTLTEEELDQELEKINQQVDEEFEDELQSWEEMLADDTIEGIDIEEDKLEVTRETIRTHIALLFPKIVLHDEDYEKILDATTRYNNGETFSYFNSLPNTVKNYIKSTLKINTVVLTDKLRMVLNDFAENIIQSIIESQYMNVVNDKYQLGVKAVSLEGAKNIQKDEYWTYVRKFFNTTILDKAKEYEEKEDTKKAEKCRGIFYAFKESYNFSIMKDLYTNTGKLKVKKIMIEKFNRTCTDFNGMYEKNSKTIINVHQLFDVIREKIAPDFDDDVIKEFICIFIRYTQYKHMSPDNVIDHTFMYYFIFNMVTIDTCNPDIEEDVQFKDQLINNVNEFLQLIVDKRQDKERKK